MKKRTVLVTGSNRGIGLGIANAFYETKEYNVIATARNIEDIDSLKKMGFIANLLDVTDSSSVADLFDILKERNLLPDTIVNNAGIASLKPFIKLNEDELTRVMNTNFYGTYRVIKKFIPDMAKKRFGRIINISSVLAAMPQKGFAHYCASKAAIEAITRNIAIEYADRGITANCIAPGFVDTDILSCLGSEGKNMIETKIPLNEVSSPDDIGKLAIYIASARHMTGETINLNAGLYFR